MNAVALRIPELVEFPESQRTPALELLLGICHKQQEQIHKQQEQIVYLQEQARELKDEISRLKGEKGRPNIKPSTLEKGKSDEEGKDDELDSEGKKGKRPGSAKRKKTKELKIHKTVIIPPEEIPSGSVFKGYEDYVVQGIRVISFNTKFRRERWLTPDGNTVMGKLPAWTEGSHFDPELRTYLIKLHQELHVTQLLIEKHITDIGVDISNGQLNRILTERHEGFHTEKAEILQVGLQVSDYIGTDDTGGRHLGKNCYTTIIGNELFTWFETTSSKSRINFLELLRSGFTDYVINEEALCYMQACGMPKAQLVLFQEEKTLATKLSWKAYLKSLNITNQRHIRIATEGALYASLLNHGMSKELAIISDDAGQFNIAGLLNALCWVHAERNINKINAFTEANRKAQEKVRGEIWDFYQDLKAFKTAPLQKTKDELEQRFDEIFTQKTCFQSLNLALGRLHNNKQELLLVLKRPEIPLHNNLRENDIRDFVKKRKISASTRSEQGRKCRDTFLSIKKTCQKLGISFGTLLLDRISQKNTIPPLAQLIRSAAVQTPSLPP